MTVELEMLLPPGSRSRMLKVGDLDMHLLEAGDPADPLLLLLHGFPELAFSWRHQLAPLAAAGFHVVAPDQRGYGRTTGEDRGRLEQFRILALASDMVRLVGALGHGHAACVVGHDFGSPVAGWSALARPDLFRACVLMSAPFPGAPPFPAGPRAALDWVAGLKELGRKHYQLWYATDEAAPDMDGAPQGLRDFLLAYLHMKSGDWAGNRPFALKGWQADELAKLPEYYVMRDGLGMVATVAPHCPAEVPGWLGEAALELMAGEYARTGFGGGLLWYRAIASGRFQADFELFAGRRIEVPAMFLAGARDWGIHQSPGALEAMERRAAADWRSTHLVEGAGHWVQQERPGEVTAALLAFLAGLGRS
jgi:pimeloyl-ACP methyl ester carboxylesterase